MTNPENPQAEQMRHESMRRTLRLQVAAIWPQERLLFDRYEQQGSPQRILDVGCGTGEGAALLAERFPHARITGIDVEAELIALARDRCAEFGERVTFEVGDAFQLAFPDASFDIVACRHLLQILPQPERVLPELTRVTRPGGWVHVLAEDYGMIYFHPTQLDNTAFWHQGPIKMGMEMNTNMRGGRATYPMMHAAGLADIRMDMVIVDTLRVSRDIFIGIWEAWRDGFTDAIAAHSAFSRDEVAAHWEDMLACLRNPSGYASWQIPVWSGQKP